MKQYLLIDIGGTFIKYSLADEQARKISGGKVPTPLTNMDDLLAVIEGFAAPLQGQFVGCAISMPGRIRYQKRHRPYRWNAQCLYVGAALCCAGRGTAGRAGDIATMASVPQQRRAGRAHWPG